MSDFHCRSIPWAINDRISLSFIYAYILTRSIPVIILRRSRDIVLASSVGRSVRKHRSVDCVSKNILVFFFLNTNQDYLANSVDPDQPSSEEASLSGFTLSCSLLCCMIWLTVC